MDAETCSSCSAKVRSAGTGLKSYLSSGKSSAMAISLRPISFHCDTTACDALGAAFGAPLFAFATNREPQPTATATTRPEIALFIFSLRTPTFTRPAAALPARPESPLVLTHQLSEGLSLPLRVTAGCGGVSYYSRTSLTSHDLWLAAC